MSNLTDIPDEHIVAWMAAKQLLTDAVNDHDTAYRNLHRAAADRAWGIATNTTEGCPTTSDMYVYADAVRAAERTVTDAGARLYVLADTISKETQ